MTGATAGSSGPAWKRLFWVSGSFAVCRLPTDAPLPVFPVGGALYSATRTDRELSIVCDEAAAPAGAICEAGWRALRLAGPIPFTVTGVIAAVSAPLARARLPMFAVSTYDTDYVLVRACDAQAAREALESDGFRIEP